MSKDKKKDVFDELVNDPTFIKEADDAWKNIDKLPSLCPHCNCMTKTIKSLCGKCGGSKNNTPYIEELAKKHQKAFPKDFYLWSEHGWWLKQLTKTIEGERERVIGEIEKEARKIFIDMRDNPDCVYVDFKGDDKRYKGEEGIALESFREGIFDYFKRLDDSINKLKK